MRIAKLRFPTTMAPENLIAYGKCPVAASTRPIMFRPKVRVKNFLLHISVVAFEKSSGN